MDRRKQIQDAAFSAHNNMSSAQFYAMLAYKYGDDESLISLRNQLSKAIDAINATLEGNAQ